MPLRRSLIPHEVATAFELGWSNLVNGDLLAAAEGKLEALVTTDKNLRYQQNSAEPARATAAILVLPTTNWLEIRNHLPEVTAAVNALKPGDYRELQWTT